MGITTKNTTKRRIIGCLFLSLMCLAGCDAEKQALSEPSPAPPAVLSRPAETSPPEHTDAPTEAVQTDPPTPAPTQPSVTVPPVTDPPETISETVPETQPHVHQYRQTGGKEPTCMEEGTKIYTCTCGESYTDTIMFLGHIWDSWIVSREPTDTQEGEGYYLCTRCGAREISAIPKLEKKLTNDDWQEIARLTLQYINEIRNSQGACTAVEMPGCTLYAKKRSEQMAAKEKVEHSYADSIAAATELQYGRYIDPALYGLEGEPYYQVYGGEAVGNGYGKTAEEVARCLADGVSNSPQHWNYVGADKNSYMSIGVTLNNGWWYCCIITSPVNLDENPLGY